MCNTLRDHLKPAIELLDSLAGSKLADVEGPKCMRILRCLSTLEGVLLFSLYLLESATTMMPEIGGGEDENDTSMVLVVRYVNLVSMRNGPASHWGIEPKYLFVIHTGGLHCHSRRDHGVEGLSRMHLGHHADASEIDIGNSVNAAEPSQA
eukprot:Gb_04274 [translate_table: standard]